MLYLHKSNYQMWDGTPLLFLARLQKVYCFVSNWHSDIGLIIKSFRAVCFRVVIADNKIFKEVIFFHICIKTLLPIFFNGYFEQHFRCRFIWRSIYFFHTETDSFNDGRWVLEWAISSPVPICTATKILRLRIFNLLKVYRWSWVGRDTEVIYCSDCWWGWRSIFFAHRSKQALQRRFT